MSKPLEVLASMALVSIVVNDPSKKATPKNQQNDTMRVNSKVVLHSGFQL